MTALLVALLAFGAAEAAKPNVVIFFLDDLGWADVGSYGGKDARTPNIDRLARAGARLTDYYAAAATCTPTRAAFMTGRYQHRIGIENVLLEPRDHDLGLPTTEPTLPRVLKDAGYATGLVGKWHLGFKPEFAPRRHGFDEFFGFLGNALDYYSHVNENGRHELYENEQPVTLHGYLTDEIGARAVSFIDRHASGPFFLDVSFNATHFPFQPPGLASPPAVPAKDVVETWAAEGTRADYVKMLERADDAIGHVLAALDRHGLAGRTLVIFTSDNGGEWLSRMGPLFQRKGSLYEGGIRVPCLLRWPGRVKGGTSSRQVAITMDLTATIAAAAGAKAEKTFDGIDLLPLLAEGGRTVERTLFWRSPIKGNPEKAMRTGKWKWISTSPAGLFPGFLFDLEKDPGERSDLAMQHPDVVRRLKAMHVAWERDVAKRD